MQDWEPEDQEVGRLSYVAWALWVLGYPNQALWRIQEGIKYGPATIPSYQHGASSELRRHGPSTPGVEESSHGAGRGCHSPLQGVGVCVMVRDGNDDAGLGIRSTKLSCTGSRGSSC